MRTALRSRRRLRARSRSARRRGRCPTRRARSPRASPRAPRGLRRIAAPSERDQRDEQPERSAEVGHRRELRLIPRRTAAAAWSSAASAAETNVVICVAAPIIHSASTFKIPPPTLPAASPARPPTAPALHRHAAPGFAGDSLSDPADHGQFDDAAERVAVRLAPLRSPRPAPAGPPAHPRAPAPRTRAEQQRQIARASARAGQQRYGGERASLIRRCRRTGRSCQQDARTRPPGR